MEEHSPVRLAVVDRLQAAALSETSWEVALADLAAATGSRSGQLIGLGADAAVPFNIATNVDPEWLAEFAAMGGGEPARNPRVAAGISAPALTVLAEADYLTLDAYRRDVLIQHLAQKWDLAHSCLTPLERTEGLLVGLAVLRSQKEGPITDTQKAIFASLAAHARGAVRAHIALQGQAAALLAGAMDAISLAAFVCDGRGRVGALTARAESLLAAAPELRLSHGRLRVRDKSIHDRLMVALEGAGFGLHLTDRPTFETLVVPRARGAPLVLDVIRLPHAPQHVLGFMPRTLVIARDLGAELGYRADTRRHMILRHGLGLTPSEADIALRLAAGDTPEAVATARGAAVSTVRAQIKAILRKLRLTRQLELATFINRL